MYYFCIYGFSGDISEMKRFFLLTIIILLMLPAICSGAGKGDNIDAILIDAVSLYNEGDYNNCRAKLLPVASVSSDNDAVFYYLGMSDFALGDMEEAELFFKKAAKLDPGNFWYRDRLARLYSATGKPELTTEIYEGLAKDFPKNVNVYYALVSLYGELGKPDKMLEALDEIDAISGKSEVVALTRYDILNQMRRTDEAFAVLEDFNKEFTSARVLSIMGDAKLSQYKDSLAFSYYDEALSEEPAFAPALLGKAEVYRIRRQFPDYFALLGQYFGNREISQEDKGRYFNNMMQHLDPHFINNFKESIDTLADIYVGCAPNDSTALQMTGSYFYSTSRVERAGEHFSRNRVLYPESLPIRVLYVQYLALTQRWGELLEEAERGHADFPGDTEFLQMKSAAYFNLKDYAGCIRESERVIAVNPKDTSMVTRMYTNIGDTYCLTGENAKAFKAYEKAIAANPKNAMALNNYAYNLCLSNKNLKKAYKMSQMSIEMEPDNATYLDTFGWILYTQGKPMEAKAFFKHAMLYGGKEQAAVLDHYAEVLYALKEYDRAKVYWNLAKSKNKEGVIPDLDERVKARLEAIKK